MSDDGEFWGAWRRLHTAGTEGERGRAWADAMTWCYDHGDRLAWCVVLAQFAQEVRAGRAPPRAALESLALVFDSFRAGQSFDEAFGMKRPRRGNPGSLKSREIARTQARLVARFADELGSVDAAAAHVAATPALACGLSEPQIKRNYLRYVKIINSE